MTIKDQIKDEKIQYDINREAAKISALSSGKIDKYEYLTCEEILASNQQIIEQAKFTYSPMGKAFEEQTKTIEDQGKKQIDTLAGLRETKPNKYGDYFIDGLAKIRELYKPIDFNDLTYNFKDLKIAPIRFIKCKGPLHIFKSIHNGDIPLQDIEKEQIELERDLGHIKQGDPRDKSEEQKKKIDNIKSLYNSRGEVVKMFNNYAGSMSRNIYDSKQDGRGLKILTPKQMLQRLPIALTQTEAGNNS